MHPPRPWSCAALPLAAAVLALVACAPADDAPLTEWDISADLRGGTAPLGFADLGSGAEAGPGARGWQIPEIDPVGATWSHGSELTSETTLLLNLKQDGVLTLRTRTAAHLDGKQRVSVLLNGVELGQIVPRLAASVQSVPVPASALLPGENVVTLACSHFASASDLGVGESTWRTSVAVDWIALEPSEEAAIARAKILTGELAPPEVGEDLLLAAKEVARLHIVPGRTGSLRVSLAEDSSAVEVELWDADGTTSLGRGTVDPGEEEDIDLSDLDPRVTELRLTALGDGAPARIRYAALLHRREFAPCVLIVVDTLRADHVLDPEGRVATPSIDRLAADGASFTAAFAHAPMTLPSHTSLFSSRLPHVTGVVNNAQHVPADLPLLPEWLAACGYRTRGVVSIGTLKSFGLEPALDRGFEHWDAEFVHMPRAEVTLERLAPVLEDLGGPRPSLLFAHFADPHLPYMAYGTSRRKVEVFVDGEPLAVLNAADGGELRAPLELEPGEHSVELTGDGEMFLLSLRCRIEDGWIPVRLEEGSEWSECEHVAASLVIPGTETVPVELCAWVWDTPTDEQIRERYRLEVEHVDTAVGALLDSLRERGLYDRSLIVFTSDHGEELLDRGMLGHANALYDEHVQVPLIVKPPLEHPSLDRLRAVSGEMTGLIDVTPTILDILGLPPLPGQTGRSVLHGEPRVLVTEARAPESGEDQLGLRDANFKLIYRPERDEFELYDLELDPLELTDVFAERGHERSDWQELLRGLAELELGEQAAPTSEVRSMLRALGYLDGG